MIKAPIILTKHVFETLRLPWTLKPLIHYLAVSVEKCHKLKGLTNTSQY